MRGSEDAHSLGPQPCYSAANRSGLWQGEYGGLSVQPVASVGHGRRKGIGCGCQPEMDSSCWSEFVEQPSEQLEGVMQKRISCCDLMLTFNRSFVPEGVSVADWFPGGGKVLLADFLVPW